MEPKYYLPWGLSVKMALMGYNLSAERYWARPRARYWARPRAMKKPWTPVMRSPVMSWFTTNFSVYEPRQSEDRKNFTTKMEKGKELGYTPEQFACNLHLITAITWDQAKEWFREKYDVDFYERPHITKTKEYICDPLGRDFGTLKLEAKPTPHEALEQCLEFLCTKLPPLPLNLPKPEKENSDVQKPELQTQ